MALELSARARLLNAQRNISPNIILEIEGLPNLYSALDTLEYARFGENHIYFGQPGLVFGGSVADETIKPYISLSGSGSTINQQLEQDKGSSQSVSSLKIELLDKNGEITKIISPGFVLDEILSKKAIVYFNYGDGLHPEDSVIILKGIISEVSSKAATIAFTIAHPEQQKRQKLFIKQTSKLSAIVSPGDTTVSVLTTNGFISSNDANLKSYIKINDEIIQAPTKSSTQFTGLTRGQLGTVAASHAIGDEVSTFYSLQGTAIELALKLMLSQPFEYATTSINNIGAKGPTDLDPRVIFFSYPNTQRKYGLVVGDKVNISGSLIGGNNISGLFITGFGQNDLGSWVSVNQDLSLEFGSPATVAFVSKYATMAEGLGMSIDDVDVARHEQMVERFSANIPDYTFYLEDEIDGKEFLSKEIYFPANFYSLPRQASASVGLTLPPIADQEIRILDENTVVDPGEISPTRSVNQGFYNSVIYKYDKALLEDKFLTGSVTFSADSQSRFKAIRNKPLIIESKGLRPSNQNDAILRTNSQRLLDRYQFAAQKISGLKTLFKTGYPIDVGDTVVFGSAALKVSDILEGNRDTQPQLYEVVNKSLNIKTGDVSLDLLSTGFEIDGRYGVIAPSSYVDTGSTVDSIVIKDSFSTTFPNKEKDKWSSSIGLRIAVHSQDWSFYEEVTLTGFEPSNDYRMLVSPSLSIAPPADYIVDISQYPSSTDAREEAIHKLLYAHFNPQIEIVSGASTTVFDVGAGDVGKIFVGSIVRIHNDDFTNDSPEVLVNDITGNTITVDGSLGFVPSAGEFIELIGFPDKALPYRVL
jgi:hypothetical protein